MVCAPWTHLTALPAQTLRLLRPLLLSCLLDTAEVFDAIVSQAESLPRSAAQVAVTGNYDDVPPVVLSARSSSPSQMKGHAALARLSSQGKHIVNADELLAEHSCQI